MSLRRTTAVTAAVAALAPAVLLAATEARADGPADPTRLPACTDVATAYGDYVQDTVRSTVTGVPDTVVAGDGWHEFTAAVTGTGDRSVPLVAVHAMAWRETDGGTELGPYATVQVATADGGWQPLSEGSSGYADPVTDLAAHTTVTYRFRFEIAATAPADVDSGEVSVEAVFADTYRPPGATEVTDCAGDATGDQGFRIRPAGSNLPPPDGSTTPAPTPTSTPTSTPASTVTATEKPAPTPARSGPPAPTRGDTSSGAVAPAAGPQLAATGSADGLPLLAALGAATAAAGAAVLAAGRRRNH